MINNNSITVRRGEIFLVDLGEKRKGSIQCGIRPCIIVQAERGNRHSTTTLVVPLSTKTRDDLPMHVPITNQNLKSGTIHTRSIAMCEQIRIIEKDSLIKKFGKLTAKTMENIDRALMIALGYYYQSEAVSI
jgi:mRNA interferase MazF